MKRKINLVGTNTLTVSLPTKWSKRNNVNKGDEIEIIDKDTYLILNSQKEWANEKKINIKLRTSDYAFIRAIMRNVYIHGFETLNITYNSESDYVTISKAIEDLDGYEIVEEKSDSCTIKTYSDIKNEDFKVFYNKQYSIIKYQQELLMKALKNNANKQDYDIINSLSKKSSKYACMCRRSLTKNKLMNNDDAIIIFTSINLIHMITRNYKCAYIFLFKNKPKIEKSSINFAKEVEKIFNELYELHTKKKKDSLEITKHREKLLRIDLINIFNKKNNGVLIHYLAEVTRIIGTMAPKLALMNSLFKEQLL